MGLVLLPHAEVVMWWRPPEKVSVSEEMVLSEEGDDGLAVNWQRASMQWHCGGTHLSSEYCSEPKL